MSELARRILVRDTVSLRQFSIAGVDTGEPLISLKGVSKVYGQGTTSCVALSDITLKIPTGIFLALTGPSGSGKTTLLNLVGGLENPTCGDIKVAGRNLAPLKENEISELRLREVGFVFQTFNLIPVLSVAENVEFPLLFRRDLRAAERRLAVSKMLRRVALDDKAHRRPGELSAGERQRVALARAVVGNPAIVLADEPTANLDQKTGQAVIELMHSLNREGGTTFLYATHDPELVSVADDVVRLHDGRLRNNT